MTKTKREVFLEVVEAWETESQNMITERATSKEEEHKEYVKVRDQALKWMQEYDRTV